MRRKFDEALKGLPPKQRSSACKAQKALDQINRLFVIERALKQHTPEERLQARGARNRPVVQGF